MTWLFGFDTAHAMTRLASLLKETVRSLELDLSDKIVITEAASGPYAVTPILAAIAGAQVFAFGRDSDYGTFEEVAGQIESLLGHLGNTRVTLIDELEPDLLSRADIITNSGHLRPINRDMLRYVNETCVIPLMYEKWEFRQQDIDLPFCNSRGIRVGGTNERHPRIGVFDYLGDMAIKLIFDAGLCLRGNRFVVVANNDFGPYVAHGLARMAGRVGVIGSPEDRSRYDSTVDWLADFPTIDVPAAYRDASAVLFTAYPFDTEWIGDGTAIAVQDLQQQFAHPFVLRFAGDIRVADLDAHGIAYHPRHVKSGHMGILPSDIGPDPVVRLQAGGLKAAQLLMEGETDYEGHELVQVL
ncbi:MAG: hypothetical protein ABFS14_06735 [Gemmatimonadota bacterium]